MTLINPPGASPGSPTASPESAPTAGPEWDRDAAQHALDDLFQFALRYTNSEEFHALVDFIADFRLYSPFNALLAHIQMPGASYVAPAYRWARDYERRIRPGARPIVLLQPGGPVMFVFDVSDTEPLPDAEPLPRYVTTPSKCGPDRLTTSRNGRWRTPSGTASASSNTTAAHRAPVKFTWRNPAKLSVSRSGNARNKNFATWRCGTSCS